MDGTDVVAPQVETVAAAGETLEVRPLTVLQIIEVTRLLKGLDFKAGITIDDLPALMEVHGAQLVQAVAVAVKRAPAFIGDLDAAAFLDVTAKVVEVNVDFFVQRLAPKLGALLQGVRTPGAGPTPSRS